MNSTEILANGTTSLSDVQSKLLHLLNAIIIMVSIIGISGNTVALYILTSSTKIKASKPYVLLMNQSLLDLIYCLIVILNISLTYHNVYKDMNGLWDSVLCHLFHSNLNSLIVLCGSSYNLVALSLDRMVSILWPIMHRIKSTRRIMLTSSVVSWIFGCIIMMPFSIPVNGIDSNNKCYYWDKYRLNTVYSKVHMILLNVVISIVPLLLMLSSFVIIYIRIATRKSNTNVKLNVIKMLTTCVCLFCACHIPRVVISIYSRFFPDEINAKDPLYIIAIALLQFNPIVNPIIYCLQYIDYKRELSKQFHRLLSLKINLYKS